MAAILSHPQCVNQYTNDIPSLISFFLQTLDHPLFLYEDLWAKNGMYSMDK